MIKLNDFNKEKTEEITDLSIAIDYCTSIFVFLDLNHHIIYLNFKALQFFANNENSFKYYDTEFNPHKLIGNSVSYLDHLVDEHPELLSIKAGEDVTLIKTLADGDLCVKLKFSPIMNEHYRQIGLCLEISDVSHLAKAHKLFKASIESALKGDFSNTIEFNMKHTDDLFFNDIFQDVNHLYQTFDSFFQDLQLGFENISTGNLSYCIPVHSEDVESNVFESIKKDLNYTSDKLRNLVMNIHEISLSMNNMITRLMAKNSEVAMTIETKFLEAEQAKSGVNEQIATLKNNSSQIEFATHSLDLIPKNNDQMIYVSALKHTITAMGTQIKDISQIVKAMERFFMVHVQGLKQGLAEINQGSLGKGINMIQNDVTEIVSKSDDAMKEISRALERLEMGFETSNDSIDHLVDSISEHMLQMNRTIQTLANTVTLVKQVVSSQDKTFDQFEGLTHNIDHIHYHSMSSIEAIILSTSELVHLGGSLESAISSFILEEKQDIILGDINFDLNDDEDSSEQNSIMFLWD